MTTAPGQGQGSIRDYLQIIFHRKWFFLVPFVIVFFTASIGSFFLPKYYKSSTLILVEEEKPVNPLATKEIAYASPTGLPPTLAEQLKTITEKILNYPHLLVLVKTLGLDKGITDQMAYEKMLMGIRIRSEVKMRSPDVFFISYEDKDPIMARNVVRTLVNIFIDESRSKKDEQAKTAVKFAEEQAEIYKRKLEESEKILFEFRAKYPMQLPGKELDYNVSMLTSYQTSLTAVEMNLKESERKLDLLKRQMSGREPVIISEELLELNPTVSRLNSQLQNLQSQQEELMATKPDSADLATLQVQMEDVREKLRLETEKMVDSDTSTTAPLFFQRLSQKVKDAEKELNDLKKRRDQLLKLVKDYEAKIQTLPEQEKELALLTRDTEVNENVYKMLMLKTEENRLTSAEVQEKGTKYTILDDPRIPLKPSKPEILLIGIIAFILGALSGFGCVFMAEFADHSFRGVEDAKAFLKLEIFGGVSAIIDKNEASAKAARQRALAIFIVIIYVIFFTIAAVISGIKQDEVRRKVIEIANKEKSIEANKNAK
ncbi:MAG: GNVR domain-containing protein [Syntrophorhabdaceae bacterium]|jgi:polysaccharide chain length determinant protein (PEP-CTERM system associated)|nr:GNVR domain-containing protein [Syntrophorhabdaceae bacterium]